MRHKEGMRITLIEETMLDSAGILKDAPGSERSYGLPPESIELFLLVIGAGAEGLHRDKLPKEIRWTVDETVLALELQNLVAWEKDKQGRNAYLVITWRGQEVIDAARPRKDSKLAAQRRAAMRSVD